MAMHVPPVLQCPSQFSVLLARPGVCACLKVPAVLSCRWATFIGLAIMAMSAPASGIFVGKIIALRRGMLKYTDNRVKLMNQLLAGIRVLKIYAWEAACGEFTLALAKAHPKACPARPVAPSSSASPGP